MDAAIRSIYSDSEQMIQNYWFGEAQEVYLATQLALGSGAPGLYDISDLEVFDAGTDMIGIIRNNR